MQLLFWREALSASCGQDLNIWDIDWMYTFTFFEILHLSLSLIFWLFLFFKLNGPSDSKYMESEELNHLEFQV